MALDFGRRSAILVFALEMKTRPVDAVEQLLFCPYDVSEVRAAAAAVDFDCDPGGEGMDAALLLAPVHGADLPPDILDATVRAVEAELRDGDFVRRYRGDDGIQGEEGAFLICSFWLVDALLATDRAEEARALFDRMLALSNDLGLFSEEADSKTGAHLGNFPQAFTHLALISAAVNLSLFDEGGADAIRGSFADRAERATGATHGLSGILASLFHGGKPLQIKSSKSSVLRL